MTISFSAVREKNTLCLKASSQGVELKKSYWFVLFPRWSGEYISHKMVGSFHWYTSRSTGYSKSLFYLRSTLSEITWRFNFSSVFVVVVVVRFEAMDITCAWILSCVSVKKGLFFFFFFAVKSSQTLFALCWTSATTVSVTTLALMGPRSAIFLRNWRMYIEKHEKIIWAVFMEIVQILWL